MAKSLRRARRVGPLITAVGVVHVASTPVFFPESVRSVIDGRVFGTVSAEPSAMPVRAAGFWYAMAGVAVAAFGWMTGHVERNGDPLPAAMPAVLAGVGAVGVALDPRSGFWLFFPLAWIARGGPTCRGVGRVGGLVPPDGGTPLDRGAVAPPVARRGRR